MKKLLWTLLCSGLGTAVSYSQSSLYLKGEILAPGFQLEYNFNPKHSLTLSNNSMLGGVSFSGEGNHYDFLNISQLQYRYYYNLDKRKAKGLNINYNNANYFYASMKSYSKMNNWGTDNQSLTLMPVIGWGFQRTIKESNWYYGMNIGIGAPLNGNRFMIAPVVEFKFGYLIHKKTFNKPRTNSEINTAQQ